MLHGGSGLSDEDFRKAIANGIAKVNIFTDINNASAKTAHDLFKEGAGIGLERRRLDLQKVDLRLAEFDLVVFVDPTEDILTESVSFVSFLRRKMHQIPLIVEPHI